MPQAVLGVPQTVVGIEVKADPLVINVKKAMVKKANEEAEREHKELMRGKAVYDRIFDKLISYIKDGKIVDGNRVSFLVKSHINLKTKSYTVFTSLNERLQGKTIRVINVNVEESDAADCGLYCLLCCLPECLMNCVTEETVYRIIIKVEESRSVVPRLDM